MERGFYRSAGHTEAACDLIHRRVVIVAGDKHFLVFFRQFLGKCVDHRFDTFLFGARFGYCRRIVAVNVRDAAGGLVQRQDQFLRDTLLGIAVADPFQRGVAGERGEIRLQIFRSRSGKAVPSFQVYVIQALGYILFIFEDIPSRLPNRVSSAESAVSSRSRMRLISSASFKKLHSFHRWETPSDYIDPFF